MIHIKKVQLLIVWACLSILTNVKGNVASENSTDRKLIIVNPSVSYEGGAGMDCNVDDCSGENEHDSCICRDGGSCLCTKFEDALHHVEDNTVIVINGTLQEFTANIVLSNIVNISIIGYYKLITINCHARGSVMFKNCKNIIIENITWTSCGNNEDNRGHGGVIGT